MQPIVLIQHCQSEHHVNDLTGGWTDTPLTALGRQQAACLASRIQREFDSMPLVLYCSDLKRAQQTAEIIGESLGIVPQPNPCLREFNAGTAAWKKDDWAREHAAPRPPKGMGLDRQPFPEAETQRLFYERVCQCMDRLYASNDSILMVVSHGGTTQAIISWWLHLDVEHFDMIAFHIAPAGITVLHENSWHQRQLTRLNDLSHLYEAGLATPQPVVG